MSMRGMAPSSAQCEWREALRWAGGGGERRWRAACCKSCMIEAVKCADTRTLPYRSHRAASNGHDAFIRMLYAPPPPSNPDVKHEKTRVK